jgi:hypothetical protein
VVVALTKGQELMQEQAQAKLEDEGGASSAQAIILDEVRQATMDCL